MSPIVSPRITTAMLAVLIALVAIPPVSLAGPAAIPVTIHVCVDARGHVAYQGEPCGAGQRARGVRSDPRPLADPALAARTRAIEQEMDRRNRGAGTVRVVRAGKPAKAAPDPCKAAKAHRKATLDRAGLHRSYDLVSRVDRAVWEACKGF